MEIDDVRRTRKYDRKKTGEHMKSDTHTGGK